MAEGLITIVLPIYNVEKYLDRCISSVVHQTYRQLEILLIDDGSPDSCPAMCDAWAQRDRRIRVIHKPNAGVGFARNTGIEHANGEYICFFDSDDYVDPTLVEECYHMAKKEQADLVCFGNDRISRTGRRVGVRIPSPPKNVYAGSEILEFLVPKCVSYDASTGEDWNLSLSACWGMIAMHAIRKANWRFVSERGILSEDYYSMLDLYQHLDRVVLIRKAFYHYCENSSSLSRTYRADRYQKLKQLSVSMAELADKMDCSIEAEIATMFLNQLMGALRQIVACREGLDSKMRHIKEMVHDSFLQDLIRSYDFSGDTLTKRALYWAISKKSAALCFFLAFARNLKG